MRTTIKDVLYLAPEANWGEEPTTPNYQRFNFVNDGSFSLDEGFKAEKGIGGTVGLYGIIVPKLEFGGLLSSGDLELFKSLFPDPSADFKPPSFTVKAGNPQVGMGVKVYGFVPTEIKLEGKVGEAFKFSVSGEGADADLYTLTESPTRPDAGAIIMWHAGIVTIGGNNYQCADFSFSYKHTVKIEADISAKAAGKRRARNLIGWGLPEFELSAKIYLPYSANFGADSMSPVSFQLVVGDMTIDGTGYIASRKFPIKGGEDLWVMDLEIKGYDSDLTITVSP